MATELDPAGDETFTPNAGKRVMDADTLLANLSALANVTDADNPEGEPTMFPITLTVSGTVIAGYLISAVAWGRAKAEEFSYFDKLPEFFTYEPGEEITPDLLNSISYVHLAEATIYQGNGQVRLHHWRGLISRVDGWEWGRLAPIGDTPSE